jgi:hypothetical protein
MMEERGVSDSTEAVFEFFQGFGNLYARLAAWLARRLPSERQRLPALTIVAGGACGLAAVAFHVSIVWLESLLIGRANSAHGHTWIAWTIISRPWVSN